MLAQAEDAPAFLTVRGNVQLLGQRAIAVVGARNASANGQHLAETLARDLGAPGLLVVSGLARGIDAAAHRGALASGTLAVISGGIDVAYPRENCQLQDAIAEAGALVTEARPSEQPTARHFPRRSRIIAGIAEGVVVVEAAPRSGSLITARLAGEYGRDVFAVPGAAHDLRGRGTNQLLREGAILTEPPTTCSPPCSAGSNAGASWRRYRRSGRRQTKPSLYCMKMTVLTTLTATLAAPCTPSPLRSAHRRP